MYEPTTRTIEAFQQLGGILETRLWIDAEGHVAAPERPGLGVVLNEQLISEYAI